jgi:hypothetical protein
MKRCILLLFFINSLLGCDPVDDQLTFINPTTDTIYYTYTNSDLSHLYNYQYDTSGIEQTYLNYIKTIVPNSRIKQPIAGGRNAWERYILQYDPKGSLIIYTFEEQLLKKIPWQEVIEKNRYKTKDQLSLEDLKRQRWEVRLVK